VTGVRRILVAAVALALAMPAQAQVAPAAPGPVDDLRCAAWAALVMGLNKDDPEVASALSMALAWFIARYEGATGKPFEEAMTPEYLNGLTPELPAIEEACKPRMQEMGQRFTDWGKKLQTPAQ
jgi:hypothetical protein